MAYANILVRNIKPKNNSYSIALDSIVSFELIPYNGDVINLNTLNVKITISGGEQPRQIYNLNSTSSQLSVVGNDTEGYVIKIDLFPNSELKFDPNTTIAIDVTVQNTLGSNMKKADIQYSTIRLDQIEALIDLLSEVMEVTVNREQGRIEADKRTVSFTWNNWSVIEEPKVYKNDILITSGYTINKSLGTITFDTDLRNGDPTDRIEADYKHGVFTQSELIHFMEIGLAEFNAQPRQSNFNIRTAPAYAQAAIILGGAYYAICAILMGLINQQSRVRWGDEENWEKVQSMLTTLKENYKGSITRIYESKKLRLAQPMAIVLPEYTLPGGRSRFFRYLYKEGGSM